MIVKLMTFNIQHGRNHNFKGDVIDLPLMASTVKAQNADIVGFNEVRLGNNPDHSSGYSDQASFFAEALGGNSYFGKAIEIDGYCYGNAIWSKHNIESFEVIPIPDATERVAGYYYESRCIIKTVYNFEGKRLTVLNSHFGLGPGEHENAVDAAIALADAADTPVVLMGDFNMIPDYHLIKKLQTLFIDAHYSLGKDELTFPSNAPDLRIDYIFTRGVKVLNADTVKVIAADHYPITAEIEF